MVCSGPAQSFLTLINLSRCWSHDFEFLVSGWVSVMKLFASAWGRFHWISRLCPSRTRPDLSPLSIFLSLIRSPTFGKQQTKTGKTDMFNSCWSGRVKNQWTCFFFYSFSLNIQDKITELTIQLLICALNVVFLCDHLVWYRDTKETECTQDWTPHN